MLPSGSFRLWTILTTQPTLKISFGLGSSVEASCWVARKIFLSPAMASSSARTLDSRPTTNGVIMYGKMTTSRMGIIGSRLVSDFSFEVSMVMNADYSSIVRCCVNPCTDGTVRQKCRQTGSPYQPRWLNLLFRAG